MERALFTELPGWREDPLVDALAAFRRSCEKQTAQGAEASLADHPALGTRRDWLHICDEAARVGVKGEAEAVRVFFETWFGPHRATADGESEGLFTGYYEPELEGSLRTDPRFPVPLYRAPEDMVSVDLGSFRPEWASEMLVGRVQDARLVPMPTRAEIEAGALAGRGLELVWVKDRVDAFFLQVQGSGRIRLADGRRLSIGYAGKNGHPYYAIGRELVARGEIDKGALSMQTIRAWLKRHPDQAPNVMALNSSYVFFRPVEGDGPVGTQGVVLTPGRSLAVDPAFVPLGLPIWLDTLDPLAPDKPLRRLVVAQDTGGAIRGPVRGDLFWGSGPGAEAAAGTMKAKGRYWLLLPKAAPATGS